MTTGCFCFWKVSEEVSSLLTLEWAGQAGRTWRRPQEHSGGAEKVTGHLREVLSLPSLRRARITGIPTPTPCPAVLGGPAVCRMHLPPWTGSKLKQLLHIFSLSSLYFFRASAGRVAFLTPWFSHTAVLQFDRAVFCLIL